MVIARHQQEQNDYKQVSGVQIFRQQPFEKISGISTVIRWRRAGRLLWAGGRALLAIRPWLRRTGGLRRIDRLRWLGTGRLSNRIAAVRAVRLGNIAVIHGLSPA